MAELDNKKKRKRGDADVALQKLDETEELSAEAAQAAKEKAEAAAQEAKDRKRVQALEYLQTWENRATLPWRFNKKLQQWWVDHWGSTALVSKGEFARFLDYAATIAGAVRGRLADDAAAAAAVEAVEDTTDPAVRAAQKKRIRAKKLAKVLEAAAPSR
jgi:hypothetical protein